MQSEISNVLLILKSLGANYPVLKSAGYEITKVPVLVVESGQARNVIKILANYRTVYLPDKASVSCVDDKLKNTNSEYVFVLYHKTRKMREILAHLVSTVKTGCVDDGVVHAVPIVISEESFQAENMEDFFVIHMEEKNNNVELRVDEVVPDDDQLSVVQDKIGMLGLNVRVPEEQILLAATCFLYPALKKNGKFDLYEILFKKSAELVRRDEDNRDTGNIAKIFIDELYAWQENTHFSELYKLPEINMQTEEKLDQVMLYDEKFVYMREKIFKLVCNQLLRFFSLDVIKKSLVDAGILYPESSRTFTRKVNYYNLIGEYKRVRMFCIQRTEINRLGEMDFVDLCLDERRRDL